MNKSLITNVVSVLLAMLGYFLDLQWLLWLGIFALSGAITNWLAIHMLFNKVPGLIGSGVIPRQFEAFKSAIKTLMMQQFFNTQQINQFIEDQVEHPSFHLEPVVSQVDLSPAFTKLVEMIMNSSFGSMLSMFGGASALDGLQEPFDKAMRESLIEISSSESFKTLLEKEFETQSNLNDMEAKIEAMIDHRLESLTPELVKQMLLTLMHQHLGWLVVWGGVFGGLIGALSAGLILS
jgi:uncharacterized membrane protein YheB (UPF0754 family)